MYINLYVFYALLKSPITIVTIKEFEYFILAFDLWTSNLYTKL